MVLVDEKDIRKISDRQIAVKLNFPGKHQKEIKPGNKIGVVSQDCIDFLSIRNIENPTQQLNQHELIIQFLYEQKEKIPKGIKEILFYAPRNRHLIVGQNFLSHIRKISRLMNNPSAQLFIRKRNSEIETIFFIEKDSVFSRQSFKQKTWNNMQKKLFNITEELNIYLRMNQTGKSNKIFEEIRKIFHFSFLDKLENENREIKLNLVVEDIENEPDLIRSFIPIQQSYENIYSIYGFETQNNHHNETLFRNNETIIVSGPEEGFQNESEEICRYLDYHHLNYRFYQTASLEYDQREIDHAGFFHYCGHGIRQENGNLQLKNIPDNEIIGTHLLTFLNSCQTGLYPDGIVYDLAVSGNKWIIASPFELPEKADTEISFKAKKLYQYFHPEYPELSIFWLSVLYPVFKKTYQVYHPYHS